MALIDTVTPEKATGIIKEAYDMYRQRVGIIPKPMEMMSASPAMFEIMLRRMQYLAQHPKLSFALLAHIRYLVSCQLSYRFCTDFNQHLLKKQGYTETDIRKLEADPNQALLEDNETALLAFVVNATRDPGSVKPEEIERLRAMGWEDRDLVDAMVQGVGMIDHAIMMQVFQMDQECMVEG